ncbi:MAG: Na(+)-translocating NADH-quinone reductase subunit C [Candidatus Latescibacteria bacterium]|jgi:Na+-transporting NADH:ubiquinone oxidoreductase subunit C|nr:Na(+)-translocating NADH-quinone reductase subunit C [Candidatus Latescibacterota bacterium]MBT4136260.1 Na(+)-translocating NADH-quinone reductase subunit C [Candidatus Latescibacterota bacterium]
MQKDSIQRTILVALGVCLVCSVLVSGAAVSLSSIQKENKRLDKVKNILIAGGLYDPAQDIQTVYDNKVVPLLVELDSGRIVGKDAYPEGMHAATYDLKKMASDPTMGRGIDPGEDIANIRKRPKYIFIYEVIENDKLEKIILPIYGYGLWSTLYGFVSLGNDFQTIQGITYYEHAETPGLGGEVDNPRWKGLWAGKKAFDGSGNVAISVIKGAVDPNHAQAKHQVDGLSGATITTRGVHNMLQYWLSDKGYGRLIETLKEGGTRG